MTHKKPCPKCGRSVAINKYGSIRVHKATTKGRDRIADRCPASTRLYSYLLKIEKGGTND